MTSSRLRGALLATLVATVLGTAAPARAVPILTNVFEEIVPYASHVVRGRVDHASGRVRVLETWRGEVPSKTIDVPGLETPVFSPLHADSGTAPEVPTEAVLLLETLDGRFRLVERRAPRWLTPHSAIRYLHPDGQIYAWLQWMSPGDVCLMPEGELGHDAFRSRVLDLLQAHPYESTEQGELAPEEAKRFYEIVEPHLDYYARKFPGFSTSRSDVSVLRSVAARLLALARGSAGLLRERAVDAYLMLARRQVGHFALAEEVNQGVAALLAELGPQTLRKVAEAELDRGDVWANLDTMAILLRRIGGEAAKAGRDRLVRWMVEEEMGTMRSKAYWALVSMGERRLAETLR